MMDWLNIIVKFIVLIVFGSTISSLKERSFVLFVGGLIDEEV